MELNLQVVMLVVAQKWQWCWVQCLQKEVISYHCLIILWLYISTDVRVRHFIHLKWLSCFINLQNVTSFLHASVPLYVKRGRQTTHSLGKFSDMIHWTEHKNFGLSTSEPIHFKGTFPKNWSSHFREGFQIYCKAKISCSLSLTVSSI